MTSIRNGQLRHSSAQTERNKPEVYRLTRVGYREYEMVFKSKFGKSIEYEVCTIRDTGMKKSFIMDKNSKTRNIYSKFGDYILTDEGIGEGFVDKDILQLSIKKDFKEVEFI
jgi:hypothetical protein